MGFLISDNHYDQLSSEKSEFPFFKLSDEFKTGKHARNLIAVYAAKNSGGWSGNF
jgi:hypothetical protein